MFPQKNIDLYNKIRPKNNRQFLCIAPFTTINFEQNGNMTACCQNRSFIFGKYPQTIEESWNSKQALNFRQSFSKTTMSNGCNVCANSILYENYESTYALKFDNSSNFTIKDVLLSKLSKKGFSSLLKPQIFEFELSNKCNLECTMCNGYFSSSIRANREKLPELRSPYDAKFVDEVKKYLPYLKEARFLGGEPFLIKIYYEIWENIINLNPSLKVSITTNATTLTKKAKLMLEKMNCGIIISIESVDKENYESIRKNADFDKVMENIRYFQEYTKRKNTFLSFAICPIVTNWEFIPEIVRFANENNIGINFNMVWSPEELSLIYADQSLLDKVFKFWEACTFDNTSKKAALNISTFNSMINNIKSLRLELQDRLEVEQQKYDKEKIAYDSLTDFFEQLTLKAEEKEVGIEVLNNIKLIREQCSKLDEENALEFLNYIQMIGINFSLDYIENNKIEEVLNNLNSRFF